MLILEKIDSGYGKKQVLYSISLTVQAGEIVAVIGPNGAGKSTVLKVVHGLLAVWRGKVIFKDVFLNSLSPATRVSQGITFAPQGNRVFGELTVLENLEIGGCQLSERELKPRLEEVLHLFPLLAGRRKQIAGRLSGGERQMLAVARALMVRPKLLVLDEASAGLSPKLVETVFLRLKAIRDRLLQSIPGRKNRVQQVLDAAMMPSL